MYTRMMMMQERSYSSAVFWKHHLFRTFGKSQYCFSCPIIIEYNKEIIYTKLTQIQYYLRLKLAGLFFFDKLYIRLYLLKVIII